MSSRYGSYWQRSSLTPRTVSVPVRLLLLALATVAAGCSSLGARPWQRDLLSREDMLPNGHPLEQAIDDHLYFSKEASSGGRTFAGGGCGCN
jgi:Domain of unknown function (DUF4266)